MSEFSGKCDLWDTLYCIWGVTDKCDWSLIKIYQKEKLLPISSVKDLIKYAPYVISSSSYYAGEHKIRISHKPWIDIEEQDSIEWRVKLAQKAYRSCKRKGEEFIPEEVAKKYFWRATKVELEICKRVKEHPYSPKVDDIRTNFHNFHRELWYNAMLEYGYDKDFAREWTRYEVV